MRILADLADVKELKKAFNNKEDIHSLTASQVFNVPLEKVDKNFPSTIVLFKSVDFLIEQYQQSKKDLKFIINKQLIPHDYDNGCLVLKLDHSENLSHSKAKE